MVLCTQVWAAENNTSVNPINGDMIDLATTVKFTSPRHQWSP